MNPLEKIVLGLAGFLASVLGYLAVVLIEDTNTNRALALSNKKQGAIMAEQIRTLEKRLDVVQGVYRHRQEAQQR